MLSPEAQRSEAKAEKTGGFIKRAFGRLFGSRRMQMEGEAKLMKGEAREEAAKSAARTKGKIDETIGAVENRVGHVIDNDKMVLEGKAREVAGQTRQEANR